LSIHLPPVTLSLGIDRFYKRDAQGANLLDFLAKPAKSGQESSCLVILGWSNCGTSRSFDSMHANFLNLRKHRVIQFWPRPIFRAAVNHGSRCRTKQSFTGSFWRSAF